MKLSCMMQTVLKVLKKQFQYWPILVSSWKKLYEEDELMRSKCQTTRCLNFRGESWKYGHGQTVLSPVVCFHLEPDASRVSRDSKEFRHLSSRWEQWQQAVAVQTMRHRVLGQKEAHMMISRECEVSGHGLQLRLVSTGNNRICHKHGGGVAPSSLDKNKGSTHALAFEPGCKVQPTLRWVCGVRCLEKCSLHFSLKKFSNIGLVHL